MAYSALVLSFSVLLHSAVGLHHKKFPPDFQFGAATSAYQVEGGWNASDKGVSIWDKFCHDHPELIIDKTNGDVSCDSYHQWRQDVQICHNLGLDFYRFSISWSRLLPTGFSNKVSKSGVKYYNNLINGLLEKNVRPVITLYHWDLPQLLQELGGWTNPLITDWFAEYASVVFKLFADRVKMWVTINEPNLMCDLNYNTGFLAPRVKDPTTAAYLCNKHVLVAHAKAWRLYDRDYKRKYHGIMSIANHAVWMDPVNGDEEDIIELAREHSIGRYTHPIYSKQGGWPPIVEKKIAEYSKEKGYATSRLPPFTQEEILLIRGSYDYLALNYYTSRLVRKARPGDDPGVFFDTGAPELGLILEKDPEWPIIGHDFVPSYPKGLRSIVSWIRQQYGDLNFFVTENGYGNTNPDLEDYDRVDYYRLHLEQILNSIHDDGANITGFTAWSLIDNFEWISGYTQKFGLHQVDFTDPERKRIPRASAHFFADLIKRRTLDIPIKKHLHKREHTHSGNSTVINDLNCLFISFVILVYTLH
ncbi:myrosinase 1-like [Epargyreus clarus]|uniref:myrosinase 1-like n=1 Tax=Epargyreus clarus TaxID=520877 RepID=UPI003C2B76C5